MTPKFKNVEAPDDAIWHNSEVVNSKFWLGNPGYLLSIPPRISKYAEVSEDALLQCHIDIAGRDLSQQAQTLAKNLASELDQLQTTVKSCKLLDQ
jgi:hypothetical protein